MTLTSSHTDSPADSTVRLLIELLNTAETLLVKKLSNNDRDWARLKNKHQAGVYIPPPQRDSGFFPALSKKDRAVPSADEIREVYFQTSWPQIGSEKRTRLVHYTGKGPETHMTGLPKEAFASLSPASYLVMARRLEREYPEYICLTIDSGSDEAAILQEALGIEVDFIVDIRRPESYRKREHEEVLSFAEQVVKAWLNGEINKFAADEATMPAPQQLAHMAREAFCRKLERSNLNAFELDAPGDCIREISRIVEWGLFRSFQNRQKAVAIVRLVMGDRPGPANARSAIKSLVENLPDIDRLMLSASQQRKSRAGLSFENHIEGMLTDSAIPFQKQVIIETGKRPDFVLPSLAWLNKSPQGRAKGLILSAKTTLRERWKQVQREMKHRDLFLATVDENVSANAIEDMGTLGIVLVVPESLKRSGKKANKITEYHRHKNVIDFKSFFEIELAKNRLSSWQ